MVLQRMGSTRPLPSLSRLAKSWATGTLAAAAVGLTSGAAFSYLHPLDAPKQNLGLTGDHPAALPAVTVTETVIVSPSGAPSGDQCLQLDPGTLAVIDAAVRQAPGDTADVTLPASVVITCPAPTGAAAATAPAAPSGQPTAATGPSTRPAGQSEPPPAGPAPAPTGTPSQGSVSPAPVRPPSPRPSAPSTSARPTTTAPAPTRTPTPTVTSTAS